MVVSSEALGTVCSVSILPAISSLRTILQQIGFCAFQDLRESDFVTVVVQQSTFFFSDSSFVTLVDLIFSSPSIICAANYIFTDIIHKNVEDLIASLVL